LIFPDSPGSLAKNRDTLAPLLNLATGASSFIYGCSWDIYTTLSEHPDVVFVGIGRNHRRLPGIRVCVRVGRVRVARIRC